MAAKNVNNHNLEDVVAELKFDNEKVIKPTIKRIETILARDVYVTKDQFNDFRSDLDGVNQRLKDVEKVTKNSPVVEKVVFTLIGIVLTAVFTALVYLVVNNGVTK